MPVSGYGLVVCKDLDYPGVGRDYAGAGVLLVPGLDFDRGGWLHSRIAMIRGVESGLTIVWSATRGRVTASDSTGRVLAETGWRCWCGCQWTPPGTVYTRLGDWFAWLCLAPALAVPMIAADRNRLSPMWTSPK
jgi:apolipoprotein N-acyltransferase